MAKMGRPTVLTPEVAQEILERLANGETLLAMCRDHEHLPDRATVARRIVNDVDYCNKVASAREAGSHVLVDEARQIADDGTNDWMAQRSKDGEELVGWKLNGEHVQRSKLRIETRYREAEAILPKVYGKRTFNEISGAITINNTNDDELIAELLNLAMTGRLKIPGVELHDTDDEPPVGEADEDDYDDIA